jgi:hypothetical protein
MRWLEVRRHSLTKQDAARGHGSHLSAEGVALARLVGASLGPFASVVTSASPRAVETAVAMGFAVDDTVDLPSGYVPGEVEHHDQWRWRRPYRTYAGLLGRGGRLAAVAEAHRAAWTRVVEGCRRAPPPWSCATVAASSRRWWPACRTPTTDRGVRRSPTATASASASTAASSASSSVGHRRGRVDVRPAPPRAATSSPRWLPATAACAGLPAAAATATPGSAAPCARPGPGARPRGRRGRPGRAVGG